MNVMKKEATMKKSKQSDKEKRLMDNGRTENSTDTSNILKSEILLNTVTYMQDQKTHKERQREILYT